MFPLSLSHRAFEWIALLRLIFFRELRENMSLSNKKNKLLDESEIKEKIHFIENNFLNFDSTYEVITQDELNAKVRRYGELELSENTEKKISMSLSTGIMLL